jgi:hypothetical protein
MIPSRHMFDQTSIKWEKRVRKQPLTVFTGICIMLLSRKTKRVLHCNDCNDKGMYDGLLTK